jgi:hypothetical protein
VRGLDVGGTDAPLPIVALVIVRTGAHEELHVVLVVANQVRSLLPEQRALYRVASCYENHRYCWEVQELYSAEFELA